MNLSLLIEHCLTSQGQEFVASLAKLMKAVKFIEENGKPKEMKPIEHSLFHFAKFLKRDVTDDIQGYAISIFRRVPINEKTRDELITLANSGNHPLLIEALSQIGKSLWTVEIEEILGNALEHKASIHHALGGLHLHSKQLKREATVVAITQVAHQAFQFESTPSHLALIADKSLMTLALLTRTNLKQVSVLEIEKLVENTCSEKIERLEALLKLN